MKIGLRCVQLLSIKAAIAVSVRITVFLWNGLIVVDGIDVERL